MSKEILILGEFSVGKTALINMVLGAHVLSEKLVATDMPVTKISGSEPKGIYYHKGSKDYFIKTFSELPKNWNDFDYAGINIPNHPYLANNTVIWDTPGFNSTTSQHINHLENFLNNKTQDYRLVIFILPTILTATSLNFLKNHKSLLRKMQLIINIKDNKTIDEIKLIERDIRLKIAKELESVMITTLNVRVVCEKFNNLQNNFDLNKNIDWDYHLDAFRNLVFDNIDSVEGDEIIEQIIDISEEKEEEIIEYNKLTIDELLIKSKQNDSEALFQLGKRFALMNKYSESFNSYFRAFKLGNRKSIYELAECYRLGNGVLEDLKTALDYYMLAAKHANMDALFKMASIYINIQKRNKEGFEILQILYKKGYWQAAGLMGDLFYDGNIVEKNYQMALKYYLESLANKDDSKLAHLGCIYDLALGVERDREKAIEYYLKASANEDTLAQYNLALIYLNEIQNEAQGLYFLKKSASKNYPPAILYMGHIYLAGIHISKNEQEAFNCYLKASENGLEEASYFLAKLYLEGTGTSKNVIEAMGILQELVGKNNSDAICLLGECYLGNYGIGQNRPKAFKYLKQAADLNHPYGCYLLYLCYTEGIGVNKNEKLAKIYLQKAKDLGYDIEIAVEEVDKSTEVIKADTRGKNLELLEILKKDLSLFYENLLWETEGLFTENSLNSIKKHVNYINIKKTIDFDANTFIDLRNLLDDHVSKMIVELYPPNSTFYQSSKWDKYTKQFKTESIHKLIEIIHSSILNECLKSYSVNLELNTVQVYTYKFLLVASILTILISLILVFFNKQPIILTIAGFSLFIAFIYKRNELKKIVDKRIEDAKTNAINSFEKLVRTPDRKILKIIDDFVISVVNHLLENENNSLETYNRIINNELNYHNREDNSWCFVVTATFGSKDASIVDEYRKYRDTRLKNSSCGRLFISVYYKIGPLLAAQIEKHPNSRKVLSPILSRLIRILTK